MEFPNIECFAEETAEPAEPSVLAVDDSEADIAFLKELIGEEYEFSTAGDGHTAFQICLETPPDLILLNAVLPDMDGFELCRRLKNHALTRDIPVIFMTDKPDGVCDTTGLELGAVDSVSKPFNPPLVRARVRTHMSLRRSMEKLQQAYDLIAARTERMEAELEMGRKVQMSLVPRDFPPFPDLPSIDLYASLDPALETCGDFYDWFPLADGQLCVIIADVSGKGVPASLFMAMTRAVVRSKALPGKTPGEIITAVNDVLAAENTHTMFTTLFLLLMDPRTGILQYSNAGHNPPLIKRADGSVHNLPLGHGPAAGAVEDFQYGSTELQLAPDDTLLMFTDGVTESRSPDNALFSDERLKTLVAEAPCCSARDLVETVRHEVAAFEACTGRTDDITILALRYAGE